MSQLVLGNCSIQYNQVYGTHYFSKHLFKQILYVCMHTLPNAKKIVLSLITITKSIEHAITVRCGTRSLRMNDLSC